VSARYGVRWPDGSVTGAITDSQRLAASYAKQHDGTVYPAAADGNPIEECACSGTPSEYEVNVNLCNVCHRQIHAEESGDSVRPAAN